MDNPHLPYTQNDIIRYLDGRMTTKEMRQLELEALDDPFLQDAIDGYREAYEKHGREKLLIYPAADLPPAITDEKTIPPPLVIPLWRRKILQYAIAVALVTGTGWYIFNLTQPDATITRETDLPQNNAPSVSVDSATIRPSENATPAAPGLESVKTAPVEKQKTHSAEDVSKNEETGNFKLDVDTENDKIIEQQPVAKDVEPAPKSVAAAEDIHRKKIETRPGAAGIQSPTDTTIVRALEGRIAGVQTKPLEEVNTKFISGKVVDTEKFPLDNITLQVKGRRDAVVSDELGRFKMEVPDTATTLVASGTGYKTREFVAQPGSTKVELQLESSGADLQEVVVSSYAKARKKALRKEKTDLEIDTADASPIGGWENFVQYIQQNKPAKTGTRSNSEPVKIVLGFELYNSGLPVNVEVLKSGGKKNDKEAIRLLKKGPRWINKSGAEPAEATISILL